MIEAPFDNMYVYRKMCELTEQHPEWDADELTENFFKLNKHNVKTYTNRRSSVRNIAKVAYNYVHMGGFPLGSPEDFDAIYGS